MLAIWAFTQVVRTKNCQACRRGEFQQQKFVIWCWFWVVVTTLTSVWKLVWTSSIIAYMSVLQSGDIITTNAPLHVWWLRPSSWGEPFTHHSYHSNHTQGRHIYIPTHYNHNNTPLETNNSMIPIFLVPAIVRPYTAAGDLWPPARDNRSSVAGRLRCHQAAARLGSPRYNTSTTYRDTAIMTT